MSVTPWDVVLGSNLYLGVVCLAWPFMAFMSGFAFDAPSDTISPFADWGWHVAACLLFLYPILLLVSLAVSILAYRAGPLCYGEQ